MVMLTLYHRRHHCLLFPLQLLLLHQHHHHPSPRGVVYEARVVAPGGDLVTPVSLWCPASLTHPPTPPASASPTHSHTHPLLLFPHPLTRTPTHPLLHSTLLLYHSVFSFLIFPDFTHIKSTFLKPGSLALPASLRYPATATVRSLPHSPLALPATVWYPSSTPGLIILYNVPVRLLPLSPSFPILANL